MEAAALRLARGICEKRTMLSSFIDMIDYCCTAIAYAEREESRVLFLDKRNALIADEVQGVGTVDHTPSTRARWCAARWSWAPRR